MPRPSLKACNRPGCPNLTGHLSGKCDGCRRDGYRDADAQRPSSAKRGYGRAHQDLRKSWQRVINTAVVNCARCQKPIVPGEPWDLDHTEDRTGYLGPSHARCNRATQGRLV